jgi:hypothetical protein
MAWQKTFSLSKRAKGCHLVTEEVLAQINEGLQGIQASCRFPSYHIHSNLLNILGWHAVSFHVCRIRSSSFPDNRLTANLANTPQLPSPSMKTMIKVSELVEFYFRISETSIDVRRGTYLTTA